MFPFLQINDIVSPLDRFKYHGPKSINRTIDISLNVNFSACLLHCGRFRPIDSGLRIRLMTLFFLKQTTNSFRQFIRLFAIIRVSNQPVLTS